MILHILEACHDDNTGGYHFGRNKTLQKIAQMYYWKGICNDTGNWVSTRVNIMVVRIPILEWEYICYEPIYNLIRFEAGGPL